jgi:hypothetical protein
VIGLSSYELARTSDLFSPTSTAQPTTVIAPAMAGTTK